MIASNPRLEVNVAEQLTSPIVANSRSSAARASFTTTRMGRLIAGRVRVIWLSRSPMHILGGWEPRSPS